MELSDILGAIPKMESVLNVWRAFGWSEGSRSNLPSRVICETENSLREKVDKGWSTLVHSVKSAAVILAELSYPACSIALLEEVGVAIQNSAVTSDAKEGMALKQLIAVILKYKKRTIQGRVPRFILVKGVSKARISQLRECKERKLGGSGVDQAFADYNAMESGRKIEFAKITNKRFRDEDLERALKFVLAPTNVGTLSWGTKRVQLGSNEIVTLPAIEVPKNC